LNSNVEYDIDTLLENIEYVEVDENATLAVTSEIDKTLDQNIRGSTSSKRPSKL